VSSPKLWVMRCFCYLSDEHLSVMFWDGRLRRGNGGTVLLRERESRDIGDQDSVLGVAVSQHLLSERALQFRRKRVPRPEVPQELVRVDGARNHQRCHPVSTATHRRGACGPRHGLLVHPMKPKVKVKIEVTCGGGHLKTRHSVWCLAIRKLFCLWPVRRENGSDNGHKLYYLSSLKISPSKFIFQNFFYIYNLKLVFIKLFRYG